METPALRIILIASFSIYVIILIVNLSIKKYFQKRTKLSLILYYLLFLSLGGLLFFALLTSYDQLTRFSVFLIYYLMSIPIWFINIELSFVCKRNFRNLYLICGGVLFFLLQIYYLVIMPETLWFYLIKSSVYLFGIVCYCYYLLTIIWHWLRTKRSSFESEELLFLLVSSLIVYMGQIYSLVIVVNDTVAVVLMSLLYICFMGITFYKLHIQRIPFMRKYEDDLNIFMPMTLLSVSDFDKDDPFDQIKNQLMEYFANSRPYLKDDLKIEEVALALMTNKTYLSRTLNMKMNVNFNQFVNYFRVKESMQLYINDRTISVKEMCHRSGFKNIASFTQAFKINTGCTPAEWCKEMKPIKSN